MLQELLEAIRDNRVTKIAQRSYEHHVAMRAFCVKDGNLIGFCEIDPVAFDFAEPQRAG